MLHNRVVLSKEQRRIGVSRWDQLPPYSGHCKEYLLRTPKKRIGYVNAILESFGHLARARTRDNARGILDVIVPAEWDDVFRAAVAELAGHVDVQLLGE